jgi:hypothetical protein
MLRSSDLVTEEIEDLLGAGKTLWRVCASDVNIYVPVAYFERHSQPRRRAL